MRIVDKGEKRYDQYGEMRALAAADDWVLARRFRGGTFAIHLKEWDALPRADSGKPAVLTVIK